MNYVNYNWLLLKRFFQKKIDNGKIYLAKAHLFQFRSATGTYNSTWHCGQNRAPLVWLMKQRGHIPCPQFRLRIHETNCWLQTGHWNGACPSSIITGFINMSLASSLVNGLWRFGGWRPFWLGLFCCCCCCPFWRGATSTYNSTRHREQNLERAVWFKKHNEQNPWRQFRLRIHWVGSS